MREDRSTPSQELPSHGAARPPDLPLLTGRMCEVASPDSTPPDDLIATLRATEVRLSALLEDRSRLARDLHDVVLQSLYAIGLGIEMTRRSGRSPRPDDRVLENPTVPQLNKLIHQVRGMIQGLESGMVEEFDLETELAALADTYMQVSPVRIDVRVPPDISTLLTREEQQEIVNITREAVSNCVRHAKATAATLSLTVRGASMCLLISDNGVGFPCEHTRLSGYGLSNMSARARKLGGRLHIRSHPGAGTDVNMEFPLEPVSAAV